MRDEDHLFLRVLMVVLTVVGGTMSLLLLAPPPQDVGWGDGIAGAAQPVPSDRWIRPSFGRPSAGPNPALGPVRTGETAHSFAARLALASSAAPVTGRGDRPRGSQDRVVAGPLMDMTLDATLVPAGPSTRRADHELRGDDAQPVTMGGHVRPPLPPPGAPITRPLLLMPQLSEMEPVEIVVRRAQGGVVTSPAAGLSTQGTDDDPLPEFRRFLPRAQACIIDASRRAQSPVHGKVILHFTVERTGWVRNARVAGGTLTDLDALGCMQAALGKDRYFEPRPSPVEADRAVIVAR